MSAAGLRAVGTPELAGHPEVVRRILVRAPTWLGDAVLSLPVLDGLRRTFPGAELVVSAKPGVAALYGLVPGVADVAVDAAGGARGLAAAARRLRACGCDLAALLPNAFGAALLARLAGVPHRMGYARDGRAPLLTAAIPVPRGAAAWHQADYYAALPGSLAWDEGDRRPTLTLPPAACAGADQLLAEAGGALRGRPLLAVAPGAAFGGAKRWPPERFAAVADRLAGELGAAVAVLGSGRDAAAAAAVTAALRAPAADLTGRTSLPALAALLARSRLLLSNDSGAMHVAAAVGTPVVAVFGPTDPAATGPIGRAAVLRQAVPCSPCRLRECPIGHPCMLGVSPEAVVAAARRRQALAGGAGVRHWGSGRRPAAFLDRDGTINVEAGYLSDPAQLDLIPGAVEALRMLRARGFALILVTNQAGVARELITEAEVRAVNAGLARRLAAHGVAPDGIYSCPHHPDHGPPPYRRDCTCRKPGAGLLLRAAREHGLDLTRSFMVGDHWTDVEAGRRLGLPAALVLTGHGEEEWAKHRDAAGDVHVAPDLLAAVRWLLEDRLPGLGSPPSASDGWAAPVTPALPGPGGTPPMAGG